MRPVPVTPTSAGLVHRDRELPARHGEQALVPPDESEVERWVRYLLATERTPEVLSVAWTRARWKPGISTTCTYELALAGGATAVVVCKRYLDGKDRELAARRRASALEPHALDLFLAPQAAIPEANAVLWAASADRELAGLRAFLDPRKLCRVVEGAGLAPERDLRRGELGYELLRYRAERRAVWRLALARRSAAAGTGPAPDALVARVHPPRVAERIAALRLRFQEGLEREPGPPSPRLVAHDARRGVLLEEALDVLPGVPGRHDLAPVAGTLLARLHRPTELSFRACPRLAPDRELLARLLPARHAGAPAAPPRPDPAQVSWTHGDLHADQLAPAADGSSWSLLDLDRLGPRDRREDLASWLADALAASPGTPSLELAGGALLESYREAGGRPLDLRSLGPFVACELVHRAAGALRRLEPGAEDEAARLLALARSLDGEGPR